MVMTADAVTFPCCDASVHYQYACGLCTRPVICLSLAPIFSPTRHPVASTQSRVNPDIMDTLCKCFNGQPQVLLARRTSFLGRYRVLGLCFPGMRLVEWCVECSVSQTGRRTLWHKRREVVPASQGWSQ